MTTHHHEFKAFNDFGAHDVDPRALVSRRMVQRLEDIELKKDRS